VEDVRAIFQDAKRLMTERPLAVVHDGLHTYNQGFNREFFTTAGPRIENVRSVGQRDKGLNQMVERVNSTVRDREKTFRGTDNDRSAPNQEAPNQEVIGSSQSGMPPIFFPKNDHAIM
jgi:hypothetical protein